MVLVALSLTLARPNFGPINGKPLPPSANTYDFVVLGEDQPSAAGMPVTPAFKAILQDISNLGPAFVLSSGDLVFGKDEPIDAYKKECDEVQGLLNALPCPFYNSPGSHDINGRQDFFDEYVKRFSGTYGSFHFGPWKFIQICTEEVGSSPSVSLAELGWLNDQLSSPEPKMVFHSHPIYAREANKNDPTTMGNGSTVEIYYRSNNVKYVFQGHDSVFDHQTHDGIEYFIPGGLLLVHVDGTKVKVDSIPASAIQFASMANGETVTNNSAVPLHFRHLTIHSATKPATVTASGATASIVSAKPVDNGFDVVVDVTAPAHAQTSVELK